MPAPMSVMPGTQPQGDPQEWQTMLNQANMLAYNSPDPTMGLSAYLPPAPTNQSNMTSDQWNRPVSPDVATKQTITPQMYSNPNAAMEREQLAAYGRMAQSSLADQGAGLDQLQQYLTQMQQKPQGINWTPLAAYIDSQDPHSHMVEAAKALAPMTPEQRDQTLFKLQSDIQNGRANMSKEQLSSLSDQIRMLQSQDQRNMMAEHYANEDAANMQRTGSYNGRVAVMQDNQAAQAVKGIHQDPAIMQMRQQSTNIGKAQELMNNPSHIPSVTEMNEVAQDISAALSGKQVASDMKLKEISTPTVEAELSKLKGYAASNPDQPAPPEVIAFWNKMASRLSDVYDRQISTRAQNKLQGLQTAFAHNPNAYQAAVEAANTYKNGGWKNDPTLLDTSTSHLSAPPAGQEVRYDSQGNAWVKGPDGKPMRVGG